MLEHTTRLGMHSPGARAQSNSRGCRAPWAIPLQQSEIVSKVKTMYAGTFKTQLASQTVVAEVDLCH